MGSAIHPPIRPAAVLAVLLPFCAIPPVAGQTSSAGPYQAEVAESAEDLDGLRARIRQQSALLDDLRSEEADAESQLAEIETEMTLTRDLLQALDRREQLLVSQRDSLQVLMADHGESYSRQQEALARRMRTLYRRGKGHDLELLFTADSFSSLVTRLRFSTMMARLDGRVMEGARRHGQSLSAAEQGLRVALADIWQTREETTQQRRRLQEMDEERRAILMMVSHRREDTAGRLAELEQRERELTQVLAQLEAGREQRERTRVGDDSEFGRLAGTLSWPVSHGEVVRPYGRSVHPEFKTVTVNNGINIAVQPGTPVYAVARGQVEYADHLPGFGQCVILDHGAGYYTLYASLDKVFVLRGDSIGRGEILAEVGPIGGRDGVQLYFEVRQGKTPLDPANWLIPRD